MRAVQVGGPLGAYFPPALFDTPFDYEAFAARDGLIGHGGIVVFDDTVDMAKQALLRMHPLLPLHRRCRQQHQLSCCNFKRLVSLGCKYGMLQKM